MTWKIDTIELPFGGPQSVKRRVIRKQTADKIISQFPFPVDLGPDAFEFQIKGLISPAELADQFWEDVKNPDKDKFVIEVTNDPEFEFFSGEYVVNRSDIGMTKPQFDSVTGKIVQNYNITFVQFSQDIGNGSTGDLNLDEDGVGFGDFNIDFNFDFVNFILGVDLFS